MNEKIEFDHKKAMKVGRVISTCLADLHDVEHGYIFAGLAVLLAKLIHPYEYPDEIMDRVRDDVMKTLNDMKEMEKQ